MFLGEYKSKFNGHGRLILPKKFREELAQSSEIILSRGLDGCVFGFGKAAWEKEAKKQLDISITDKSARDLRRYLFSAAEGASLDDQGRFIIPGMLLQYANLQAEVMIVGAGDHFEIWNTESWKNVLQEISQRVTNNG